MERDALRVGTRASALALRQTDIAIEAMLAVRSDLLVEIIEISTKGDEDKTTPFEQLGNKGIFAHELQAALVDGRIDVAVHSTKDLTEAEPDGLELRAFLEREDPRDVLVSRSGQTLAELEPRSLIGTSSVRREALIRIARPDLRIGPLRGNVDTRLKKVADGVVDAAVLAGAGIVRLDRSDEITEWLDVFEFVPPPGQGAIALETRAGDQTWLAGADHLGTRRCVETERAFMHVIEGSCDVPLGALATTIGAQIMCVGFVAAKDGSGHLRDQVRGADPAAVGAELGRRLLDAGAMELLGRAD
jgi:hydroxymethylbilane synthase